MRIDWMVSVTLSACVSTTSVVRSRFSVEQHCPEDVVTVSDQGLQYTARGCNAETTYVCSAAAAARGGVQCVEEGIPSAPAYRDREHPVLPPPDPRVLPSQ